MASRTRTLSVVIAGEDKSASKSMKEVAKSGDKLATQMKASGEKASKGFRSGWQANMPTAKDTEGIGDSMSGGLKKALAAGGLAAAALFAAGFMQHLDNEFAEDKLVASLGGGEFAQDMGEIAGDLYVQGFGDSVGDIGATLKGVIQNGLLAEDATDAEIEKLTAQVATFADVLDQDATEAISAVSSILRNDLAPSAGDALDILTTGIQQGADRAGDLQETFTEYSSLFRDLGLDAKDATGLLIQGLRGGARDADFVADALKELAIRGQDASESSANAFETLGLSAEEMTRAFAEGGPKAREALDKVLTGLRDIEDPVKRNATAVELFGTKAEDLGDALFNLDLDTAAAQLGDTESATDDLGTAYDNAKSKIEVFKREALEKITTFIGESVIPALEDFSTWVGDNEEKARLAAIAVGVVLVGAMVAYAASAVVAAAATIAATWPFLAVIAATAALAGLLYYAYENWGWFTEGVDSAYFALQKISGWLATTIGFVSGLIEAIGRLLQKFDQLADKANPFGGGPLSFAAEKLGIINVKGALADGGSATAGASYLVGERGPEIFTPGTSGTVIPNHAIATGGDTTVVHVHVAGSVLAERDLIATINRAIGKGIR